MSTVFSTATYVTSSNDTFLLLYIFFIRLQLEYVSAVRDPYTSYNPDLCPLIRVCTKNWSLQLCCSEYEAKVMLNCLDIPTLLTHHRYLNIITMFNIINGYHYFPTGVFMRRSIQSTRQLQQELTNNFYVPFAHTR